MSHWIYPLYLQKFGHTQKKFSLIPHRQKMPAETLLMIERIELITKQSLHTGMIFSQVYDEIIKAIEQAEYNYNTDCFVGVDFMNSAVDVDSYEFDETLFAQSSESAREYFIQVADIYNPLFLLNPLSSRDEAGYTHLHKELNHKTLIGCTDHDQHNAHDIGVVVSKIHKRVPHTQEHQKVLRSHNRGQKYIAVCHDSFGTDIVKQIMDQVQPDFIETRQPLKQFEVIS